MRIIEIANLPLRLASADLLPELPLQDYTILRDDIVKHGIHTPILVTQDCEVLDGHARVRIAAELGLKHVPFKFLAHGGCVATEAEKQSLRLRVNVHRRHLSRSQQQELIATLLRLDPTRSDRAIAQDANVDGKVVGRARQKLVEGNVIPPVERRIDRHGIPRNPRSNGSLTKITSETSTAIVITGEPRASAAEPQIHPGFANQADEAVRNTMHAAAMGLPTVKPTGDHVTGEACVSWGDLAQFGTRVEDAGDELVGLILAKGEEQDITTVERVAGDLERVAFDLRQWARGMRSV